MTEGIVYTGYAKNSRFYVKWWRTETWNDQNDCGSNIHWELHLQNGNKWYTNALGINVIEINGQQVYGSNKWSNYKTDGDYVLASGDLGVIHDNEGNKQITIRISGWFYQNGEKDGQQDFQLDKIPRGAEFTVQPYQLTPDDEEIMKIYYRPNKTIEAVQCRVKPLGTEEWEGWKNINVINGDWKTGAIFKLDRQTFEHNLYKEYYVQVRIMANGVWRESNIIQATLIKYPYLINENELDRIITLGEKIKLNIYNPLNRKIVLKIGYVNNNVWTDLIREYHISGTYFECLNDETFINNAYKALTKYNKSKLSMNFVFYPENDTRTNNYYIDIIKFTANKEAYPQFNNFGYEDNNKQVVFWTGDNQAIVKEISNFKMSVPTENMMKPQKFGTADYYIFNFDGVEKTVKVNEAGVIEANFGAPKRAGEIETSVTAVDNRGLKTTVSKKVKVYDYFEPIIYGSAERKNQFENETNIITNGKIAELIVNGVNKNIIQKVEYRYREQNGEFYNWIPLLTNTAETTFLFMNLYVNLDNNKNFEIEIRATDNFKSTTISRFVNAGKSIFSIRTDGNCYVGEDKVTTENGSWGGKTPEFNTENTDDDWVPVISGGKIQHRIISTDLNGRGTFGMNGNSRHLDFNNKSRRIHLLTAESMAWWNGCYNQNENGNYSNLEYCLQGRIQAKPTILFNNGDGQKGDITLSDNVNKYERVIIYYKDAETHANSSLVVSRSFNKYIILSILIPYPDLDIKVKVNKYLIKDKMLRLDNAKVTNLKDNRNVRYDANDIAILKVEGYK